jgi:VanZ family protein
MLTPNHVVTTARAVLVAGALTAAVLMLGPWPGLEQVFGLSDKAAHAIAFGGLVAVSFLAFPRMRRNDLAIAAVLLGASVEVAQMFTSDRSASISDLLADTAGVGVVYLASHIENLRALARQRGTATFAEIAAQDRRRGARRLAPVIQAVFPSPGPLGRRRTPEPASPAGRPDAFRDGLKPPSGDALDADRVAAREAFFQPLVQQGFLAAFRALDLLGQLIVLFALGQRGFGFAGMRGVEMLVLVPHLALAGHVGCRGAGAVREVAAGFFFFVAKDHGVSPDFSPEGVGNRTREAAPGLRLKPEHHGPQHDIGHRQGGHQPSQSAFDAQRPPVLVKRRIGKQRRTGKHRTLPHERAPRPWVRSAASRCKLSLSALFPRHFHDSASPSQASSSISQ